MGNHGPGVSCCGILTSLIGITEMNERIWELANESGFDVDKTGTFGNYSEMHRLEKFAELIVRECNSKLDNIGVIDRDSRTIAMKVISEHFGVEE